MPLKLRIVYWQACYLNSGHIAVEVADKADATKCVFLNWEARINDEGSSIYQLLVNKLSALGFCVPQNYVKSFVTYMHGAKFKVFLEPRLLVAPNSYLVTADAVFFVGKEQEGNVLQRLGGKAYGHILKQLFQGLQDISPLVLGEAEALRIAKIPGLVPHAVRASYIEIEVMSPTAITFADFYHSYSRRGFYTMKKPPTKRQLEVFKYLINYVATPEGIYLVCKLATNAIRQVKSETLASLRKKWGVHLQMIVAHKALDEVRLLGEIAKDGYRAREEPSLWQNEQARLWSADYVYEVMRYLGVVSSSQLLPRTPSQVAHIAIRIAKKQIALIREPLQQIMAQAKLLVLQAYVRQDSLALRLQDAYTAMVGDADSMLQDRRGCQLYEMAALPRNTLNYLHKYILVGKKLYYVASDGLVYDCGIDGSFLVGLDLVGEDRLPVALPDGAQIGRASDAGDFLAALAKVLNYQQATPQFSAAGLRLSCCKYCLRSQRVIDETLFTTPQVLGGILCELLPIRYIHFIILDANKSVTHCMLTPEAMQEVAGLPYERDIPTIIMAHGKFFPVFIDKIVPLTLEQRAQLPQLVKDDANIMFVKGYISLQLYAGVISPTIAAAITKAVQPRLEECLDYVGNQVFREALQFMARQLALSRSKLRCQQAGILLLENTVARAELIVLQAHMGQESWLQLKQCARKISNLWYQLVSLNDTKLELVLELLEHFAALRLYAKAFAPEVIAEVAEALQSIIANINREKLLDYPMPSTLEEVEKHLVLPTIENVIAKAAVLVVSERTLAGAFLNLKYCGTEFLAVVAMLDTKDPKTVVKKAKLKLRLVNISADLLKYAGTLSSELKLDLEALVTPIVNAQEDWVPQALAYLDAERARLVLAGEGLLLLGNSVAKAKLLQDGYKKIKHHYQVILKIFASYDIKSLELITKLLGELHGISQKERTDFLGAMARCLHFGVTAEDFVAGVTKQLAATRALLNGTAFLTRGHEYFLLMSILIRMQLMFLQQQVTEVKLYDQICDLIQKLIELTHCKLYRMSKIPEHLGSYLNAYILVGAKLYYVAHDEILLDCKFNAQRLGDNLGAEPDIAAQVYLPDGCKIGGGGSLITALTEAVNNQRGTNFSATLLRWSYENYLLVHQAQVAGWHEDALQCEGRILCKLLKIPGMYLLELGAYGAKWYLLNADGKKCLEGFPYAQDLPAVMVTQGRCSPLFWEHVTSLNALALTQLVLHEPDVQLDIFAIITKLTSYIKLWNYVTNQSASEITQDLQLIIDSLCGTRGAGLLNIISNLQHRVIADYEKLQFEPDSTKRSRLLLLNALARVKLIALGSEALNVAPVIDTLEQLTISSATCQVELHLRLLGNLAASGISKEDVTVLLKCVKCPATASEVIGAAKNQVIELLHRRHDYRDALALVELVMRQIEEANRVTLGYYREEILYHIAALYDDYSGVAAAKVAVIKAKLMLRLTECFKVLRGYPNLELEADLQLVARNINLLAPNAAIAEAIKEIQSARYGLDDLCLLENTIVKAELFVISVAPRYGNFFSKITKKQDTYKKMQSCIEVIGTIMRADKEMLKAEVTTLASNFVALRFYAKSISSTLALEVWEDIKRLIVCLSDEELIAKIITGLRNQTVQLSYLDCATMDRLITDLSSLSLRDPASLEVIRSISEQVVPETDCLQKIRYYLDLLYQAIKALLVALGLLKVDLNLHP